MRTPDWGGARIRDRFLSLWTPHRHSIILARGYKQLPVSLATYIVAREMESYPDLEPFYLQNIVTRLKTYAITNQRTLRRTSKLPYNIGLLERIRGSMRVPKPGERAAFESVRTWHREFSKATGSKRTKEEYAKRMAQFCHWSAGDPDQLATSARDALKSDPGSHWAEDLVDDYFTYMEQELSYARKSCSTFYGTLRGFFRSNGIIFVKKSPKQWAERRIRPPVRADLVRARLAAPLEGRLAMDVCNSLGWRREDIVGLSYLHVRADYEAGEDRLYVVFRSQKEEVWAANFIGREGTQTLGASLERRRLAGEEIHDDTPLLTNPRGGRMTPDDLTRLVSDLGRATGTHLTPTHFRKRFRMIAEPIIGLNPTKRMGGWKLEGVGEAYYLPSREESLGLFLQIEGVLAIEEIATVGKKLEQKVVHEDELERYLIDGWLFKAALNNGSGKVVVEREA